MPTRYDFDRYDLTAPDLVAMTASRVDVKLVHNLTDRGIVPFRREGRARLYSFGSLLTFDTMIRARGVGLSLLEGSKLAEGVVTRAKERIGNPYTTLRDMKFWEFLVYAVDRECDPPMVTHYIVPADTCVDDLQLTLISGWHADVTSIMPVDRMIWECAEAYDRRKVKEET